MYYCYKCQLWVKCGLRGCGILRAAGVIKCANSNTNPIPNTDPNLISNPKPQPY